MHTLLVAYINFTYLALSSLHAMRYIRLQLSFLNSPCLVPCHSNILHTSWILASPSDLVGHWASRKLLPSGIMVFPAVPPSTALLIRLPGIVVPVLWEVAVSLICCRWLAYHQTPIPIGPVVFCQGFPSLRDFIQLPSPTSLACTPLKGRFEV